MDNQDQRTTHTQGHEGHGVHVCHKCGYLFPNPHPSAKQRRAHKKICGTIEGSKLLVSESQTRSYTSDDEHLFDYDCNTQVDFVPKSLDNGGNEKQCGGTGENLIRSGDEVFLDAIANFSDGALSPGIRDPLRDSLESTTDVEIVHTKYPEFSGYFEDNCFNAACENVRDCSLSYVAKEINPKGNDEIMSETDMVEIVVSSDNIVGETCEGVRKLAVSDVVNLDCQVAGGAVDLKEKNNAEFISLMPQDELLLEVNSTVSTNGDGPDVAHPQNKYEDVKYHEIKGLQLQNSLSLHSSEALKPKRDDLKDSVAGENNFLINQHQLSERREVLPDMHVLDGSMKEQNKIELVDEEMLAEESIEVSSVMVESDKRSVEYGASKNAMKTEMDDRLMIHFSEVQESDDVRKSLQQISLPDNERKIKDRNDMVVDGKFRRANVENDIGIRMKIKQPSNLHLEVKPSIHGKSDQAVRLGKSGKCGIIDAQYTEGPIVKDTSLSKFASSNFECPILSDVEMDRTIMTQKGVECTDRGPLSGAEEDIKDDEVNSDGRGNEECNHFDGRGQDEELIMKAAQCISVVKAQDGEPGREVFGSIAVPVQDQSVNREDELASSAIYNSVDPGIWFDSFSFKGNSGSVSVSGLPSTDVPVSTEAAKFNSKDLKAASNRQQCEKPELFEPPSFMTLVEPGHVVGPKAATSEGHKETKTNEHTSSQAGWFPTITQVTNESQGRKRNKEKIAEITNWSPSKQYRPLKTLLGEAATHNKKPKSKKSEENPVNQKSSEVKEDNDSGLRTGNSIVGCESPATQAVREKDGKEWNSPARYPAGTKRQNKKAKGRPYWIQFVCCSSADHQRS